MIPMELLKTCCSIDEKELKFPSFTVIFIHTFMRRGFVKVSEIYKLM